jgi:hypothetical protein
MSTSTSSAHLLKIMVENENVTVNVAQAVGFSKARTGAPALA